MTSHIISRLFLDLCLFVVQASGAVGRNKGLLEEVVDLSVLGG